MEIIKTERLILRKFFCDDWKDLHEYLSQEIVVKYEPYDVFTEDACKKEAEKRSQQDAFWAVCLKETNKLIGNVYFQRQEPGKFLTWEIGCVFNPMYCGMGYATESCKEILRYGFQRLKARRIIAMCNPENTNSWRLLERLNMRREGHLQKNIFFKYDEERKPIWNDTYEYAILADEMV
ncbi:ribosomal-protein-S5-alanine N-acetyltransferase [Sporomusa ovata DSM 2662]|uniref:Acetyltransferase, GNAT family n=1 Tax=Sporomusa ovata TaxID=2378 RepID=A0A0U1L720_9FIRM|nr:GNAT family protein [Sporomusa ovata]EQB28599.1 acetyltransferase, GNAT family [Sporomusa ovata DSM 2662]CQR74933.1 acetyltransferase, GNAT family [Sporomusa ovata]